MQDPNCIFCKIASGDIPCAKVFEDETAIAFMDIGPLAEGHVLLIPKDHYVTIDQMPADQAGAMLTQLPALVRAVQSVMGCEGVNVLQNNGKAAHQEVPHVHFHLIPRNSGDAFHFNWPAGSYPEGRAAELASAIGAKI
jgi:histidine triad (HIT) family protein